MKLASVILNWNGCEMMRKYLPSVISHSTVGEVIVADNASTDGSMEMLQKEFPSTRTIVLEKNFGFAEGYNRALAQLPDYEYYLLLNSDVEIRQQGWDKVLTDYMDSHPECAACQPKLLDLRKAEEQGPSFEYAGACGGFLDRYGYPFCRGRILGTVEEDRGQYDEPCAVHWATGAALLCRATDWKACGGLDGRFFAHMEEIDLCWRLRNLGRDIVCLPQSTAWHLGGATLHQGNPRKTLLNFRNNLLMLYKNLPEKALRPTLRIRTLLDGLAALQYLLKGDLGNMKAVFKARREFLHMKAEYAPVRQAIQSNRKTPLIPEYASYAILWQYYLRGRKTYDRLPRQTQ